MVAVGIRRHGDRYQTTCNVYCIVLYAFLFSSTFCLPLSVVHALLLVVDGLAEQTNTEDEIPLSHPCSLVTFSHASNLDGFLLSSSCPVRHFALAKKELFMVPFFSWISLAIGGVPVDRNDRERAIRSVKTSSITSCHVVTWHVDLPHNTCLLINVMWNPFTLHHIYSLWFHYSVAITVPCSDPLRQSAQATSTVGRKMVLTANACVW